VNAFEHYTSQRSLIQSLLGRVACILHKMRATATDGIARSVCVCVCRSVGDVCEPCKKMEPIEICRLGRRLGRAQRIICIRWGVQISHVEGTILRVGRATENHWGDFAACDVRKNGWTDPAVFTQYTRVTNT